MKLSSKKLSWIFYSSLTVSAVTGIFGFGGTLLGDYIVGNRLDGRTPAESLQKCKDRWPSNPEMWVGCQTEKIRGFNNASQAHVKIRGASTGLLALTLPTAYFSWRKRRNQQAPEA